MTENTFASDLEALINRHSMENGSSTPDFILAQYLLACLRAWDTCVQQREAWYGRELHRLDVVPVDGPPASDARLTDSETGTAVGSTGKASS